MRTGDKIFIGGDYQYNAYYKGKKAQRFWHYTKLHTAQTQLAATEKDKILDAGCGSGLLAWFLAKDSGASVWGTDANPAAIEFCKAQYQLPNLKFSQSLIDTLPFPDQHFNKIAFLEVIEHLTKEQGHTTLKKFYDLLSPGGVLVISTPNKKSLWPAIERFLDILHLVPRLAGEQHEHLYSGATLRNMAGQTGFICTSQKTINFLAPWIAPISWQAALRIHAKELSSNTRLGSLLLYTFQKPTGTSPSTR